MDRKSSSIAHAQIDLAVDHTALHTAHGLAAFVLAVFVLVAFFRYCFYPWPQWLRRHRRYLREFPTLSVICEEHTCQHYPLDQMETDRTS